MLPFCLSLDDDDENKLRLAASIAASLMQSSTTELALSILALTTPPLGATSIFTTTCPPNWHLYEGIGK
jgi:hypothetical protein